jgi:hypothetical protein
MASRSFPLAHKQHACTQATIDCYPVYTCSRCKAKPYDLVTACMTVFNHARLLVVQRLL